MQPEALCNLCLYHFKPLLMFMKFLSQKEQKNLPSKLINKFGRYLGTRVNIGSCLANILSVSLRYIVGRTHNLHYGNANFIIFILGIPLCLCK
jgi:hypothetical protein